METTTATQHLVIGTAGHIDHGKTSLVERLTGTHTHHLPEERRRGITIDLGFASLTVDEFSFAVVDVPGHQKFIRHMVAGATGINLAMLVVAADDSVMPQTREHLEIMQLLGVRSGVIVLTKCDLVDRDLADIAEEEIRELVQPTFLKDAPLVRVSSITGEGIAELKVTLAQVAGLREETASLWPLFRMPIDRAFSLSGHGTVVTGSVLSGEAAQGEQLELLPEGVLVRVRSVQHHRTAALQAETNQRTALNLAGVKPEETSRGHELATPGWLVPTRRLLVEIQNLGSSRIPLQNRKTFLLHLGTSETPARMILKSGEIAPGAMGFAELRLKDSVVATYGQRFLLRRISPAETIAGGRILDPLLPSAQRLRDATLIAQQMASPDVVIRVGQVLSGERLIPDDLRHIAIRSGCSIDQVTETIKQLQSEGTLVSVESTSPPIMLHRNQVQRLQRSVIRQMREELRRRHPRRSLSLRVLHECCQGLADAKLLDWIIDRLIRSQTLLPLGTQLTLQGTESQLTKRQRQTFNRMLELIDRGGMSPPTVKELADHLSESIPQTTVLLEIAVEDGQLVRLDSTLYYPPDILKQAQKICHDFLTTHGPATMAQLRDVWAITRKHALPLAQYFDLTGATRREGDLRFPGPNSPDTQENLKRPDHQE